MARELARISVPTQTIAGMATLLQKGHVPIARLRFMESLLFLPELHTEP
jgi:hypothetical protein